MYFQLVQTNKDLFSADFEIRMPNGVAGSVTLQGSLGSMEAEVTVRYFGYVITLSPGVKGLGTLAKNPFRPYRVTVNGQQTGSVYQTQFKAGLFQKYDYHQAELNGAVYKMYPIGFGAEGAKNPVYCGDTQIALVEKDCVVVDDLHIYNMTCTDEQAALASLIFAVYMYVNAGYKPGVAAIKSVHKVISKTTNKLLLEKYDPAFKQRVD